MKKQREDGPKWFVPYEWRKDPNAYNYFFKFSQRARSNDNERGNSLEDENIECVICMNKISLEVDADGVLVTKSS